MELCLVHSSITFVYRHRSCPATCCSIWAAHCSPVAYYDTAPREVTWKALIIHLGVFHWSVLQLLFSYVHFQTTDYSDHQFFMFFHLLSVQFTFIQDLLQSFRLHLLCSYPAMKWMCLNIRTFESSRLLFENVLFEVRHFIAGRSSRSFASLPPPFKSCSIFWLRHLYL